jgi:drug/metabolite transporter (DMT)-like permease
MTPATVSRFRLVVAFATIYIIWGSSYLAIRIGIETLPPFLMAGGRFLVAGVLVLILASVRGPVRLTRRDWLHALVVGVLLFAGGNGALVWGEQTVPSGIAALLVACTPMWMVLIDWLRPNGHAQTRWAWAGLILGVIGVATLLGPDAFTGQGINPVGAAVILAGSVSWAAGTIYTKRVGKPRSALLGTGTQMVCGGVVLLGLAFALGEHTRFDPGNASVRSLAAVLYLTLIASVVAFTAYTWLIRVTTPARLGTYAYVNPVIAVFLGWAFAAEPLTVRTMIAAAIIVVAVAVITLAAANEPPGG